MATRTDRMISISGSAIGGAGLGGAILGLPGAIIGGFVGGALAAYSMSSSKPTGATFTIGGTGRNSINQTPNILDPPNEDNTDTSNYGVSKVEAGIPLHYIQFLQEEPYSAENTGRFARGNFASVSSPEKEMSVYDNSRDFARTNSSATDVAVGGQ